MTTHSEPFLSLKQVSKSFSLEPSFFKSLLGKKSSSARGVKALIDVSLEVKAGETMALVGESGCGKSTLLKAIVKLLDLDGGEILYKGVPIGTLTGKDLQNYRKKIQMIFQNPYASLSPRLTVGSILREPLTLFDRGLTSVEIDKRVGEMLERVGLNKTWISRYPHEFSGGQQQRIAIARALIGGPEFLAADEPVSALDVSVQAQILNLLIALKQEETFTCLFVTHDLAVAQYFSERVTVMYLGQIVEINTSEALFKNPQHPYTKILLSAVPTFEKKVGDYIKMRDSGEAKTVAPGLGSAETEQNSDTPAAPDADGGCLFAPRCPYVSERCYVETPELRDVGAIKVACHNV